MYPRYIASGTLAQVATSTTDVTPGLPSHANGDLLVMAVMSKGNSVGLNTPSGWTQLRDVDIDDGFAGRLINCAIYYKFAGDGESSPTVTRSSAGAGTMEAVIHSFRNVSSSDPFTTETAEGFFGSTCQTSSTWSVGSGDTLAVGLVLHGVGHGFGYATNPPPSGWTTRNDQFSGNDATAGNYTAYLMDRRITTNVTGTTTIFVQNDTYTGMKWLVTLNGTDGANPPEYYNSATSPADNGTSTATQITITPPSGMQAGDFVIVTQHQRGSATFSIGVDGGQSWTTHTRVTNTNQAIQQHWCVFDGTWDANPRFDFSAGTNTNVQMHVFRSVDGNDGWEVDTAQSAGTFSAPSGPPYDVTITGATPNDTHTLAIATWATEDDNTWGQASGTGWNTLGAAQYRNTSGSDTSTTYAYHAQTSSGAIPNVTKEQTANGPDIGITILTIFRESVTSELQATAPFAQTRVHAMGATATVDSYEYELTHGQITFFCRAESPRQTGTFLMGEPWIEGPVEITRITPLASMGRVTCTGTFPASGGPFIRGESLSNGSGWTAVLCDFNVTNKHLFVREMTGTLSASDTITGASSGATATAGGAVTTSQATTGTRIHGAVLDQSGSNLGYTNMSSFVDYSDTYNFGYLLASSGPQTVTPSSGSYRSIVATKSTTAGATGEEVTENSGVLTVCHSDFLPSTDDFRPWYAGGTAKQDRYVNLSDIDTTKLHSNWNLGYTSGDLNTIRDLIQNFWGPDYPAFAGRCIRPKNQMVPYPGNMFELRDAVLAIQYSANRSSHPNILRGLIQFGMDIYGIRQNGGGDWRDGSGGHGSHVKAPMAIALRVIGWETELQSASFFAIQDQQTFYVEETQYIATTGAPSGGGNFTWDEVLSNGSGWTARARGYTSSGGHKIYFVDASGSLGSGDTVTGQTSGKTVTTTGSVTTGVYNFGVGGYSSGDVGIAEWGDQHWVNHPSIPPACTNDSSNWDSNYRRCCTWIVSTAYMAAIRGMGLQSWWANDAAFDYTLRYRAVEYAPPWNGEWGYGGKILTAIDTYWDDVLGLAIAPSAQILVHPMGASASTDATAAATPFAGSRVSAMEASGTTDSASVTASFAQVQVHAMGAVGGSGSLLVTAPFAQVRVHSPVAQGQPDIPPGGGSPTRPRSPTHRLPDRKRRR